MKAVNLIGRITVGLIVVLIRAYRVVVAPLFMGGCRHIPSCSEFAEQALRRHGPRRGALLAVGRVWRCRPGGSFGYDPVP